MIVIFEFIDVQHAGGDRPGEGKGGLEEKWAAKSGRRKRVYGIHWWSGEENHSGRV